MGKKTRVYELARELGKGSKEILDLLAESGVRDKNHMSALEENVVRFIKNRFAEREGKKPAPPAETAQSSPAEAKPRVPARPKEKPRPTAVPLPVPRASGPRAARPGAEHRRDRPGPASGALPTRPSAGQRQPAGARARGGVLPPGHERWDKRWLPSGAVQASQRLRPGRQWPAQVAPSMPTARPGLPRAARPRPLAGQPPQRVAPPRPSEGGADAAGRAPERRPRAPVQRPRQIRPTITPVRPGQPGRPERPAQLPGEGRAGERPQRIAPPPGAQDEAVKAPQAPLAVPEPPVQTAEGRLAAAPPREPVDAARAERAERVRAPEEAAPKETTAAPAGERAMRPRPPHQARPAAQRPGPGWKPAERGARPEAPRREAQEALRPARAGETVGRGEAARRRPAAEARRERRPNGEERPSERRLELIKGGKGAEKLRESRAEAIIRSRMPRRGAPAQASAVSARRRERPKREKKIALPPNITVGELAQKLGAGSSDVIKSLMSMGLLVTINQEIDFDAASLVADEYGFEAEPLEQKEAREFGIEDIPDPEEKLLPRPPVITVLGHVDHGKTSLLDAIRKTNVTAEEAGGITQHIGAYQVELGGRRITFIDTPGHEAFTAMRARGSQVTDIAVLVVAADDGVMPQTIEAINHARAAKVPIIVAVNKIDKPNAQPDRVKQQLAEHGLVPEEWGGDTVTAEVSALRRQGIEALLEMILLVADMRDLRANPDRPAKGTVIEARLDKGRGPAATVLVEKGTLRVGDAVVAGEVSGKVRAMADDQGGPVDAALPSMPVEVLGFSDVPQAGDVLQVVSEDKLAKQLASRRFERKRAEEVQGPRTVSLEALFGKIAEGEIKELNLILKADVQGSVEALKQSLEGLSTDEVRVNVIHSGVGAITKSDVMLASASNAIIIGFQVRPDANARRTAEQDHVDIRLYKIIYDAKEDIRAAMEGLLEPEVREVTLGRADVTATFRIPKVGLVAGCMVSEGKITRDAQVRVVRDSVVIHEGKIGSLKRFKDDVGEVAAGYECGLSLASFQDIKEGDVIEAFALEETPREL